MLLLRKFAAAVILTVCAMAQNNNKSVARLSDDFAKAAIKYVITLQNFELNAVTSIEKAESRIESAKEDMEAAETTFGCFESALCPEHTTSISLQMDGFTHVLLVKIYHLSFSDENKDRVNKSNKCLDAWKTTLQRRDDATPKACRE